ncbi:MAG TPA: acyl-CoA dehydrogenase family protein [Ramlibacter sp.]|nr:acyl-CoA dehydrogenase family protein [Ramlibacter sp.]
MKHSKGPGVNEELKAIDEICDVIKKKIDRAYVAACGREGKRPEKLWRMWADTGLLGIGLPEEYGGAGGSLKEVVYAHDQIFQAGLLMGSTVTNHMVRLPLLKHGTEEQKRRFLPATATGEQYFAFAVTEPDAGTNTFKIKTTARKLPGGDYQLNGGKCFITGFLDAANALVVARTADAQKGASGLSLFIVDTKAKGISATPMNIGLHFPDKHYVVNFDDVIVPAENLLGGEGKGLDSLFDCLNPERLLVGALCLGTADFVLGRAVEYAKVRAPFDVPIGSYQSVQHPMAIAKARITAARALMYQAVEKYDAGVSAGLESNMVKYLASDACKYTTDIAMTTFGGSAFDMDQDIIPFFLHAKLNEVAPVNNNIILSFIAQKGLGLPRSY